MCPMLVSFIVVAYNAASCLERLLHDLENQDYPRQMLEVILVDSNSNDCTKQIMSDFADKSQGFYRIAVKDNVKRTLPCGWNVALKELRGQVVIRVDAHVQIKPDFITQNVRTILSGKDICGGRVISVSGKAGSLERTLLFAENSMFGGSFAKFRRSNDAGYVKTLAFAAYRKSVFDRVGEYDERLARTEDNEMHYRMKRAGFQLFYNPKIEIYRETRSSLRQLLRQKYLNGYWIGLTMGVSPRCFFAYHFVPLLFVLGIVLTSVLAYFGIWQLAAFMWCAYFALTITMSIPAYLSPKTSGFHLLLPIIFLMLHVSYGVGTTIGFIRMPLWRHAQWNTMQDS